MGEERAPGEPNEEGGEEVTGEEVAAVAAVAAAYEVEARVSRSRRCCTCLALRAAFRTEHLMALALWSSEQLMHFFSFVQSRKVCPFCPHSEHTLYSGGFGHLLVACFSIAWHLSHANKGV